MSVWEVKIRARATSCVVYLEFKMAYALIR